MSSPVPPAATQAQAFDPEWARRVQKKLGDVGDLSDPGVAAYANRKLRKMRSATAPATTPPATTPPATTPPTGGTETKPPTMPPVGTPGEIIDPWGTQPTYPVTNYPGTNQITGGSYLPNQRMPIVDPWGQRTRPKPTTTAEKQLPGLKPPPGGVIYY